MKTIEEIKAARAQLGALEQEMLAEVQQRAELLGFVLIRADEAPPIAQVKYSDGNGGSWSGRGKRPGWLTEALSQGRQLEDFAV